MSPDVSVDASFLHQHNPFIQDRNNLLTQQDARKLPSSHRGDGPSTDSTSSEQIQLNIWWRVDYTLLEKQYCFPTFRNDLKSLNIHQIPALMYESSSVTVVLNVRPQMFEFKSSELLTGRQGVHPPNHNQRVKLQQHEHDSSPSSPNISLIISTETEDLELNEAA